jgi:hypothetical protein
MLLDFTKFNPAEMLLDLRSCSAISIESDAFSGMVVLQGVENTTGSVGEVERPLTLLLLKRLTVRLLPIHSRADIRLSRRKYHLPSRLHLGYPVGICGLGVDGIQHGVDNRVEFMRVPETQSLFHGTCKAGNLNK